MSLSDEAEARVNRPVVIVHVDWPGDPVRIASRTVAFAAGATGDPLLDGFTYDLAPLLDLGKIENGADGRTSSVTLTLPVDLDAVSDLLALNVRGVALTMWLGYLDEDESLVVVAPSQRFSGEIRARELVRGVDEATISVRCRSQMIYLTQGRGGSRYTDQQQRALFSTDTGLSFIARLAGGESFLATRVFGGSGVGEAGPGFDRLGRSMR